MLDGASVRGAAQSRTPKLNTRQWVTVLFAGLVIVLTAGWLYWRYSYIRLDDARFLGHPVVLASPCDCIVAATNVREGDSAAADTVIMAMDAKELKFSLAEAEARAQAAQATISRLEQEVVALRDAAGRKSSLRMAEISKAEKARDISQASFGLSERKLSRAEQLRSRQLISPSDYELIETEVLKARRAHADANARLREARINLARASEDMAVISAREHELQEQKAVLLALKARVSQIETQATRRQIIAPFDAIIDRIFVRPGDFVMEGRRLMLVHDPNAIYLEVNVPETELRHIQEGSRVWVTVDAYPGREFEGTVASIGSSTTSQYSLLPATAPTGSFIKFAQRVPVRINVVIPRGLARLGMQAEVRAARSN